MRLLSADTSSRRFSIALLDNTRLVDEFIAETPDRHSSALLPEIERLLSKNSFDIEEIDAFCVGLGPGSFTGLRIGLTTIRGLAMALKKPLVGVASIDVIAHNLIGHDGIICPIIDAKQGNVYARLYRSGKDAMMAKSGFLLLTIDSLLKKIRCKTIFLGDGLLAYRAIIEEKKAYPVEFAPETFWYPNAGVLGYLGLKRLKSRGGDNPFKLAPLYIYSRECHIRKRR